MDEFKDKNILITGGLGFIGSNIAHSCVKLGAKVTIYDCLDPKSGGNMTNIKGIDDDVEIVLNDIRHFDGICSCIRKKDIIFHCAAYTSHKNSMNEPILDIEVNCKGTINLLDAMKRFNKESKLVHIGTSTQIGKMNKSPVDELHSEFPIDIYSANKSVSEKYVLIYCSAYGMRTCVIRLANTYGPRSNIKSSDFGFINFFVGLALKNKELTVFGEGKQLRNVNFVNDVVDVLIKSSLEERTNGKTFFAVGDKQLSVLQIAEGIVNNIGGKIVSIPWPKNYEAIDIGDAVISNAKIKSVFGSMQLTSFESGLALTKEYFVPCLKNYLE